MFSNSFFVDKMKSIYFDYYFALFSKNVKFNNQLILDINETKVEIMSNIL